MIEMSFDTQHKDLKETCKELLTRLWRYSKKNAVALTSVATVFGMIGSTFDQTLKNLSPQKTDSSSICEPRSWLRPVSNSPAGSAPAMLAPSPRRCDASRNSFRVCASTRRRLNLRAG